MICCELRERERDSLGHVCMCVCVSFHCEGLDPSPLFSFHRFPTMPLWVCVCFSAVCGSEWDDVCVCIPWWKSVLSPTLIANLLALSHSDSSKPRIGWQRGVNPRAIAMAMLPPRLYGAGYRGEIRKDLAVLPKGIAAFLSDIKQVRSYQLAPNAGRLYSAADPSPLHVGVCFGWLCEKLFLMNLVASVYVDSSTAQILRPNHLPCLVI